MVREKKQITYRGTLIRLLAAFSAATSQARREWHDILKVMKGKNLQPRLLYLARLSFRFEGEIFMDEQKLRVFITTKPDVQGILKEVLWMGKIKPQLETKILQMTRLTSKGIHIVKVGNYPHTNMISKSSNHEMRRE